MSIKEKDLQTIESLSDGDKLRVVTSEGNSRNVPASAVGGGGNLVLTETVTSNGDVETHTLSATYNEMINTINNGGLLIVVKNESSNGVSWVSSVILGFGGYFQVVYQGGESFPMYTEDVSPIGPAGYYFMSPWGDDEQYFYSSTADGAMIYENAN